MLAKAETMNDECADDIFCGVNIVKNPDQASDLERKHLPIITAPDRVKKGEYFEVTVEVGKLLAHPNEPGHFIQFVELYAGQTYLARMGLAKTMRPTMKVCVALDHSHGKLRAVERCNLHGCWEYEVGIEVTD